MIYTKDQLLAPLPEGASPPRTPTRRSPRGACATTREGSQGQDPLAHFVARIEAAGVEGEIGDLRG
jgi:hypothetical protein